MAMALEALQGRMTGFGSHVVLASPRSAEVVGGRGPRWGRAAGALWRQAGSRGRGDLSNFALVAEGVERSAASAAASIRASALRMASMSLTNTSTVKSSSSMNAGYRW